jgi:hypothetical protein
MVLRRVHPRFFFLSRSEYSPGRSFGCPWFHSSRSLRYYQITSFQILRQVQLYYCLQQLMFFVFFFFFPFRIRNKKIPQWLQAHSATLEHTVDVIIGISIGFIPFTVSHITLQSISMFILLTLSMIPLITLFAVRSFKYRVNPMAFVIPFVVLPILARPDINAPPLLIFILALFAVVLNLLATCKRRLYLLPQYRKVNTNRFTLMNVPLTIRVYLAVMIPRILGGELFCFFFYFLFL